MSSNSALAIALLLTANTSLASAAINRFTNNSRKQLESLKAAATWNDMGSKNIRQGAAMAAPIILATAAAAKLESKIADVAKVVDVEIGTAAFNKLSNSAMEAGKYLGEMPGEVAELMSELAAGGVAAAQLDKMAIKVGKIGVAFDVTAGEAGKAWMTIQNAMNSTDAQTAAVMDAMNATTNKFGGKAKDLMQFMAEGGASVAQTLKISGVAMQAFGNAFQISGVSASESATTMERWQKAVLKNADAAKIFNKAGGGAKGMVAILEAAQKSGNATKWLMDRDFGEYSSKIAQLANNMNGIKGVKAQLAFLNNKSNVTGSADREYGNRSKTTEHSFNQVKVGAFNNAIRLGQSLLPLANQLMVAITPIIEKISKWIQQNPKLAGSMMKVALGFAAGKMALGGLQKGIAGAIKVFGGFKDVFKVVKDFAIIFKFANQARKFATGLSYVGQAFKMLKFVFVGSPIGLIITGIAVGAYLIIKNWSKIKAFFVNLFNSVWTTIKGVLKIIAALFINFTPVGLIYKHWGKIKAWFGKLWDGVKSVTKTHWEGIKTLFLNFTPVGLVIKHWDKIKETFSKLWEGVKEVFNSFIDWVKNSWLGKFFGAIGKAVDKVRSVIKGAGNSSLEETVNKVGNAAGSVGIPSFATPSPTAALKPASRSSNSMIFSPVINLSGSATEEDAQMIVNLSQSKFEQMMKQYQHNKDRKMIS